MAAAAQEEAALEASAAAVALEEVPLVAGASEVLEEVLPAAEVLLETGNIINIE